MPIGTSGKGMVMLSGGIDSPVAAYAMAKRGMTVTAMHFMSPPYTGQAAQQKVEDLAKTPGLLLRPGTVASGTVYGVSRKHL